MQQPQTDGKVYGLIKNSGEKIVMVYFGRASSYLCNGLALLIEELASSYAGNTNVVFVSADLDQCGTAVASTAKATGINEGFCQDAPMPMKEQPIQSSRLVTLSAAEAQPRKARQ